MMSASSMSQHIRLLCRNHSITLEHGRRGRSWAKTRRIRIPEVKTSVTYATALHELGHILGYRSGRRLEKEVQAWEWAKANAETWTLAMQLKMQRSLGSYLKWCCRRKGAWIPPKEHRVWEMAGVKQ